MVESALVSRPGSPRAALRVVENRRTLGRLITCPGCGDDVDVIEVDLGGSFASMRPDLCGKCQPLARELEPIVEVNE